MPKDIRPSLPRTSSALVDGRTPGWAPVLAAMAIDLADFAMIGPTGLVAGLFVGFALTLILSLATGTAPKRAVLLAVLGGIYCMLPITDVVPLATMLTLLHGALQRRREPAPATP